MKKIVTKKNGIRLSFFLLLIFTLYLISRILSIKSEHGINQKNGMYWQPKNSIDVAMLGTSHVHCGINTALLWNDYGIAAYDYSAAEQPLWITYHYLKELYRYQKPKVIVLDLYAPARFKEDYQYDFIAENLYGMRFSLNKLEMLTVSVEPDRRAQYFPNFAVYHDRYDDLEAEDFQNFFWNSEEKEAFKGYTPYWGTTPLEPSEWHDDRNDGLTEKSEKYLRKIIALAREQGSELVFIVVPYLMTSEDERTYNRITEIAAEENLIFINYNEYYDMIGLDFQNDFYDESHLNYWGSCKFTDFLGSFLTSFDSIPDRRGQEGYESWEAHAALIDEEQKTH